MKRSDVKAKLVKEVPIRTGNEKAQKINPAAVSEIGTAVDPKAVEPFQRGTGSYGVQFGNKVAGNVGKGGPGAGRTVLARGTQGTHGPVNRGLQNTAPDPSATGQRGHDILSDYGPDYRK